MVDVSGHGLVRVHCSENLVGFFSCAILRSYLSQSAVTGMKVRLKSNG